MKTNPQKKLMIVFHDMKLGGIQRKTIDIINYIQNNLSNIEITVCLRNKEGIFLDQIPLNIKVIGPKFHTQKLDMIWFIFWLSFQILKFNPTHILSFMDLGSIPTLISLKILFWKKPKIIIGEDILTSKYVYTETRPKLRLQLIKIFYPQADKILVQTPVQKKDMIKTGLLCSSKIIISPNWLPLPFPPKASPKKFHQRKIDILFIGRIDSQKNLPKFIQIIKLVSKKFPKIKVSLVGTGSEIKNIKNLIKAKNLSSNIKIIPPTSNPEKYYLNSKIFLLTSDYEGFPLTLMEAISCGCYPISQALPEIKYFFDKYQNNILFSEISTASQLILNLLNSTPNSKIISHYQNKLNLLQHRHIQDYINHCIS